MYRQQNKQVNRHQFGVRVVKKVVGSNLDQSVSIYGNTVYELITENERTNQNVRNAVFNSARYCFVLYFMYVLYCSIVMFRLYCN